MEFTFDYGSIAGLTLTPRCSILVFNFSVMPPWKTNLTWGTWKRCLFSSAQDIQSLAWSRIDRCPNAWSPRVCCSRARAFLAITLIHKNPSLATTSTTILRQLSTLLKAFRTAVGLSASIKVWTIAPRWRRFVHFKWSSTLPAFFCFWSFCKNLISCRIFFSSFETPLTLITDSRSEIRLWASFSLSSIILSADSILENIHNYDKKLTEITSMTLKLNGQFNNFKT